VTMDFRAVFMMSLPLFTGTILGIIVPDRPSSVKLGRAPSGSLAHCDRPRPATSHTASTCRPRMAYIRS
jgi:hypothetical protein